jgi:hypothetical protein
MARKGLPLGVKDTLLLEDFSEDRDSGVDWVGDDQDKGLGSGLSDGLSQSSADTGVDLMRRLSAFWDC